MQFCLQDKVWLYKSCFQACFQVPDISLMSQNPKLLLIIANHTLLKTKVPKGCFHKETFSKQLFS